MRIAQRPAQKDGRSARRDPFQSFGQFRRMSLRPTTAAIAVVHAVVRDSFHVKEKPNAWLYRLHLIYTAASLSEQGDPEGAMFRRHDVIDARLIDR